MIWNVELGKQISMLILVIMLILIIVKSKKIEKVNFFFFAGYIFLSLVDLFFFFYTKFTNFFTEKFFSIAIIGVFFVYMLYYLKLLSVPLLSNIQRAIIILFCLLTAVMIYIEKGLFEHLSFKMFYINILLLTFSIILFFYQTFNSDKIFEIKHYLPFWISVSLLIFYIGIIPIFYFRTSVSQEIYFFILFLLNLISNSVIAAGIFWSRIDRTK